MRYLIRLISHSLVLVAMLGSFSAIALTQLQANVDRNPVLANESFVLEIVADDDVSRNAIDTSVLLKDFVVGQTRVSSSTQMVNFNTTRTTTWSTVLIARKPGSYTIPAFEAEGVRSKPIRLTVMAKQADSHEQRDVFIRSQLIPQRVYPGQAAVLETRLYLGVQLENGSLTTPESEQANFAQMGEDTDKVDIINNRRYQVITRRYAVTAEQAGELLIRPPMFRGQIVTSQRRSFFDNNRSRPVQVLDEDLTLEVMSIPQEADQPFIPAEYITLEEQSELPQQITVGEPITRKIALVATGVGEELLPAIPHQYSDQVNVYPDKVEVNTSYQGKSVIAQRLESVALIATLPGKLALPEIRVRYWDTRYHQAAEAVLPARTIEILPASHTPSESEPEPITASQLANSGSMPPFWQWLPAALTGLWLLTLMAWWLHVRQLKKHQTVMPSQLSRRPPSTSDRWQALNHAIDRYPEVDLSRPLSHWLQQEFSVQSLDGLTEWADAQAAKKIYQSLQAARFGQTDESVSAQDLRQALDNLRRSGKVQSKQQPAFRLYR